MLSLHPRLTLFPYTTLFRSRRTRADYLRALCVGASSNLYRITDHVRGDRHRAGPHRRTYRRAVRVRQLLGKIALRRNAHVKEIPERVCGISAARKTTRTFCSLMCPSTAWRSFTLLTTQLLNNFTVSTAFFHLPSPLTRPGVPA